jgi:hypothetical protein
MKNEISFYKKYSLKKNKINLENVLENHYK